MAETNGREGPRLDERLFARTYEFDFFQAVRLLEWIAWEAHRAGGPPRVGVGEDERPQQEIVRFRVPATSAFPAGAIAGKLRGRPATGGTAASQPAEMLVAFLGLIGPSGVLPQHYTADAIARSHEQDHALREFLDIFHHRAVSLFYRAWRKYRFPHELERLLRERMLPAPDAPRGPADNDDAFTFVLRCLVGLGTPGLAGRMEVADETITYYGGHYARQPRSAVALERMVEDYFGLPCRIEQFSGRWLTLARDQRSITPSSSKPRGQFCGLGRDCVVGARVWDVQTKFRVRLGPMSYQRFLELLPRGLAMRQLTDMVRLYAGSALEFDVQPVLRKDEVPVAQLARGSQRTTMLTRNAWLASRPRERDADEAVFRTTLAGG